LLDRRCPNEPDDQALPWLVPLQRDARWYRYQMVMHYRYRKSLGDNQSPRRAISCRLLQVAGW